MMKFDGEQKHYCGWGCYWKNCATFSQWCTNFSLVLKQSWCRQSNEYWFVAKKLYLLRGILRMNIGWWQKSVFAWGHFENGNFVVSLYELCWSCVLWQCNDTQHTDYVWGNECWLVARYPMSEVGHVCCDNVKLPSTLILYKPMNVGWWQG